MTMYDGHKSMKIQKTYAIQVEVDRLDFMHHIFKIMMDGKLYEAPVPSSIQHVLDVGCVSTTLVW